MNESFKSHIELAHHQLVTELQTSQNSIKLLESAIEKLQEEIKILQTTNTAKPDVSATWRGLSGTGGKRISITDSAPPAPAIVRKTSTVKFTFDIQAREVNVKGAVMRGLRDLNKVYRNGCTWLDITTTDSDSNFQHGFYTTLDDQPHGMLPQENAHVVTFAHPYATPPIVVVWLTGFDMSQDNPWRLKTFATDVTEKGFTIHINAWRDSELFSAGVAWTAYPEGDPGVYSARLEIQPPGSWKSPLSYQQGWQTDNCGLVENRRMMLVDSIEVSVGQIFSFELFFKSNRCGFKWVLIANPADALLYSLGANYMLLK